MIVLSFDVGIKNLAYCLIDFSSKEPKDHKILKWGIINCAQDILDKNMKCCVFRKGNKCNNEAVNKIIINDGDDIGYCKLKTCQKELRHNYSDKLIKKVKKITANTISLEELGKNLFKCLNELNFVNNFFIDKIVIENQPALKNPTMKSIQMILFSYFIFVKNSNKYDIILFNASKKLKIYDGPDIDCNHLKNLYARRKFLSIKYTEYLIKQNNFEFSEFFSNSKKKDDLADAYLQCLSYFIK